MSRIRTSLALALGSAIAIAGVAPVASASTVPASVEAALTTVTPTTTVNGYRHVGYWGQWMAGDPDTTLKSLFVDGAHGQTLTHLNYSFGNVSGTQEALDAARASGVQGLDGVAPGECFLSDGVAPAAGQTDAAGEADADFIRAYSAAESVLGVADAPASKQKLAGAFNQVAQLKRINPDLKVLISLGGWSWSKSFSDAAATAEGRERLVSSCIDLYIDGNLPVIDGRGGPGSAAGLFDGFDLDWEWPAAPDWAQEVGNSVDPANDRANFLALVAEFRAQLDAREAADGQEYELSAFVPASPTVITAGGWNDPALWQLLDFGNLQGYDLWGTWSPQTGHQGNVYGDPDHNWGLGLDTIVDSYTNAGVDPAQLNLGLAAYGQGWTDADLEPWGPATGISGSTRTWDQLKDFDLDVHHERTADGAFNATYGYDADTRTWFSYDDTVAVAEKTAWAIERGLGGIDYWSIGGDSAGELSQAGFDALTAAVPGPVTGDERTSCAGVAPWNALATYRAGDRATLDGIVYEAMWWERGTEPGAKKNSGWETVSACGDDAEIRPWFSDRVYHAGDRVEHGGQTWEARWWTRGDEPGTKHSAWVAR